MASPLLAPAKVHYPSTDGKPMAESDFQRTPLMYAVDRLLVSDRGLGEYLGLRPVPIRKIEHVEQQRRLLRERMPAD